jgi:quercetin dioxygenase-like cupin family protein
MKTYRLNDMTKGWFIGDFDPVVLKTDAAEVAVKSYTAGTIEPKHYHKLAPEVTLIVSGEVRMNDAQYGAGDIILIEPGEATDFEALSDVTTVVVKLPSIAGDKYLC